MGGIIVIENDHKGKTRVLMHENSVDDVVSGIMTLLNATEEKFELAKECVVAEIIRRL